MLDLFRICYTRRCAGEAGSSKVDFYEERNTYEGDDLPARIDNFTKKLANEPKTSRGVIVLTYGHRKVYSCLSMGIEVDDRTEKLIRRILHLYPEFTPDRFIFVEGKIAMHTSVEFWIVPSGAEMPKAPYVGFDPPCSCPTLAVYGVPRVKKATKDVKFFTWLGSEESNSCAKYRWTVTSGRIVSGQGTDQIVVEVSGSTTSVTASVEVKGTDPACNCPVTAAYTTQIER